LESAHVAILHSHSSFLRDIDPISGTSARDRMPGTVERDIARVYREACANRIDVKGHSIDRVRLAQCPARNALPTVHRGIRIVVHHAREVTVGACDEVRRSRPAPEITFTFIRKFIRNIDPNRGNTV